MSRKTAALFQGACRLGARLAGGSEGECRAVGRFGYNAGMAYQIADGLLDIVGNSATLRKTLGTDIQRAKATLPLIHCLRVLAGPERETLLYKLTTRSLGPSQLSMLIEATGSTAYVRAHIERFLDRAALALRDLPPTSARAALIALSRNCRHATRTVPVERAAAGPYEPPALATPRISARQK